MNISPRDLAISDYDKNFNHYWNKIFTEYRSRENQDCLWLAGPSSYVFSLGGQKFAVDLQIRREKDLNALMPQLISDLSDISFILITHQHDDHMCIPLMRTLKDTPIRWYIPYGCRSDLIEASEIKKENIVWVHSGDTWQIGDLCIRAFDTPHIPADKSSSRFVELGYELRTRDGKVLLPADVRNYDYDEYPEFGEVDLCISHLWAGNNALDEALYIPMLEKFVSFSSKFKAKRYFLCHLYEIGRPEIYLWHEGHAKLAVHRFAELLPNSSVDIPQLGKCYSLFDGSIEK